MDLEQGEASTPLVGGQMAQIFRRGLKSSSSVDEDVWERALHSPY